MMTYIRHTTVGQKLTNDTHLALNKTKSDQNVHQGIVRTVPVVVSVENATIPWTKLFHIFRQKCNFPAESKLDMRKLRYFCGDLCDMQSTVCWPSNKQIFKEMISPPICLKQTR